MDHVINGIEKLSLLINNPTQLQKLEAGARLHKRHSRITFDVLDCNYDTLTVRVTQGHHPAANYFGIARLKEIGQEMFTPFIPTGIKLTLEVDTYNNLTTRS